MKIPCREPKCDQEVVFSQKEQEVTGNVQMYVSEEFEVIVDLPSGIIPKGKPFGTLTIEQVEPKAEVKEQTLRFHFNEGRQIRLTDRIYLTCPNGHTLPYIVNLRKKSDV